jgi:hypothetical protein
MIEKMENDRYDDLMMYLEAESYHVHEKKPISKSVAKWHELSSPENFREYIYPEYRDELELLWREFVEDIPTIDLRKNYRKRLTMSYGSEYTLTDYLIKASFEIKKRMDYYNSRPNVPVEQAHQLKLGKSLKVVVKYYSSIWQLYVKQRSEKKYSVNKVTELHVIEAKYVPFELEKLDIHSVNKTSIVFKNHMLKSGAQCKIELRDSGIWKVEIVTNSGFKGNYLYRLNKQDKHFLMNELKDMLTHHEQQQVLENIKPAWQEPENSPVRALAFLQDIVF